MQLLGVICAFQFHRMSIKRLYTVDISNCTLLHVAKYNSDVPKLGHTYVSSMFQFFIS